MSSARPPLVACHYPPPVEHQKRDLRPRPPPPQSTTAAFVHPYGIFDSSGIIEDIGTRGTIDVFHLAPLQHRRDPRGAHVFLVLLLKADHVIQRPFRRRGQPRAIGIIGARGTVDVFHPAPFRVADVLAAFNILD